jgi:type II secretory pathway pseudopilin PulG
MTQQRQQAVFNSRYRAFTLLETLIAISVLGFVLLVSVSLYSISLKSMTLKAQTTQATGLARKQLEIVRNIRDNVWLNKNYSNCTDQYWACFVGSNHNQPITEDKDYQLASNFGNYYLTDFSPAINEVLSFAENSTIIYSPRIVFRAVEDNDDLLKIIDRDGVRVEASGKIYLVESTVTWSSYYGEQSVTLKTEIANWMPQS